MNRILSYIILLCCFVSVNFAYSSELQKVTNVNAIIETATHKWQLMSISTYTDSTIVKWNVTSKGRTWVSASDSVYLLDVATRQKLYMLEVRNISKAGKKTILNDKEILSFYCKFPKVDNSHLLTYYASSSFHVDSINLGNGAYSLISLPKYFSTKDSLVKSEDMFDRGMKLCNQKKYEEAINVFSKVSKLDESINLSYGGKYSYTLNNKRRYYEDYSKRWIAYSYHCIGNDSIAKSFSECYFFPPFDRKLVRYTDSLKIAYTTLNIRESTKKEFLYNHQAICKADSLTFGVNSYRYTDDLLNLAQVYESNLLYENAMNVYCKILDSYMQDTFHTHKQYHNLLGEIAKNYIARNKYTQAIYYLEKSRNDSVYKPNNDIFNRSLGLSLDGSLARCYIAIGQYDKALEIAYSKLMKIKNGDSSKSLFSSLTPYWDSVKTYASYLQQAGRPKDALRYLKDLENENSESLSSLDYLDIGDCYYRMADFDNALKYYLKSKSLDDKLKKNGEWSNLLIFDTSFDIKNKIGTIFSRQGKIKEALELQKDVVKSESEILTKRGDYKFFVSSGYNQSLSNLAYYYLLDEDYDSVIVVENRNIKDKEKKYSQTNSTFYISYENIGEAYAGKSDYVNALANATKAKSYLRSVNPRLYADIVRYNYANKLYKDAKDNLSQLFYYNKNNLLLTFPDLTQAERSRYLNRNGRFFSNFMPKFTYLLHDDSLTEKLYDATILIKGLLIDSEQSFKNTILTNGNQSLVNTYKELSANRFLLMKQLELDESKRTYNIDSLKMIVNEQEDSLIQKSTFYADYKKKLTASWKDVQGILDKDDTAIEFVSFEGDGDTIQYAAVLLRRDYQHPKMIKLCTQHELELARISNPRYLSMLDTLIWRPLEKELVNSKNIYFSPTGLLYKIGIEYADAVASKKLFRLSSTKELLTKRNNISVSSAALYGGLKYDFSTSDYKAIDSLKNINTSFDDLNSSRGIDELRGLQFSYLPQTETEIEEIEDELVNKSIPHLTYNGILGTEESLKNLSSQNISILHVSTHGAYITPVNVTKLKQKMQFLIDSNDDISLTEDINLTHSFLLLSGGNNTLNGVPTAEGREDGILTAQEISRLNFSGMKLVVLSACQTGLGDISADGVSGLQRGFKKAGAQAIIMSLCNVKDRATREFMSFFYKCLLSNNDIHASFSSAVKYMKDLYPLIPNNWSSFILLDSI